MATLRPLGVGSHILTHGDKMAGFYGEVNGIITADELRSMVGVSQGTPTQTGDITWLKFSHNYKTLYIAKQPIQHSISWDYLHERDLVFGKMVEIGGHVYLLRLIQAVNNNASNVGTVGVNSEWYHTIRASVRVWPLYNYDQLKGIALNAGSLSQDVSISGLEYRYAPGGNNNVENLTTGLKSRLEIGLELLSQWRPVLELLY